MNIEEFTKVRGTEHLSFNDIWGIYDNQFEILRDTILKMGDKYLVEEFVGSVSKVLTLKNAYTRNQVFVYINGVIQWENEAYYCTSPNEITLDYERQESDIIKVVIVKSNILPGNVDKYIKILKDMCNESKDNIHEAKVMINVINQLKEELDAKREEYEKSRRDLLNAMILLDTSKYDEDTTLAEVKIARGDYDTLAERLQSIDDFHNKVEFEDYSNKNIPTFEDSLNNISSGKSIKELMQYIKASLENVYTLLATVKNQTLIHYVSDNESLSILNGYNIYIPSSEILAFGGTESSYSLDNECITLHAVGDKYSLGVLRGLEVTTLSGLPIDKDTIEY